MAPELTPLSLLCQQQLGWRVAAWVGGGSRTVCICPSIPRLCAGHSCTPASALGTHRRQASTARLGGVGCEQLGKIRSTCFPCENGGSLGTHTQGYSRKRLPGREKEPRVLRPGWGGQEGPAPGQQGQSRLGAFGRGGRAPECSIQKPGGGCCWPRWGQEVRRSENRARPRGSQRVTGLNGPGFPNSRAPSLCGSPHFASLLGHPSLKGRGRRHTAPSLDTVRTGLDHSPGQTQNSQGPGPGLEGGSREGLTYVHTRGTPQRQVGQGWEQGP